jgi:hypothetical protein
MIFYTGRVTASILVSLDRLLDRGEELPKAIPLRPILERQQAPPINNQQSTHLKTPNVPPHDCQNFYHAGRARHTSTVWYRTSMPSSPI